MLSHRRVLALRLIVAVIGTLAMIATLVKLKAQLPVAREQCAIANLVKAGAGVNLCNAGDGTKYYAVYLAGCEGCESNDELLHYVRDIENVRFLSLASLPLHEAGRKSLFQLHRLSVLVVNVANTGISCEMYAELKREMRLHTPDLKIEAADQDGKPVE